MSQLVKFEDSLQPLIHHPYWNNLNKSLNKLGPIKNPIGKVSLEMTFEPFHMITVENCANFAKITLTSSEEWDSKINRDRHVQAYIGNELKQYIGRLMDNLENYRSRGPIACIDTKIVIQIELSKRHHETRVPVLTTTISTNYSFTVNSYQKAFIGTVLSLEPPKTEEDETT